MTDPRVELKAPEPRTMRDLAQAVLDEFTVECPICLMSTVGQKVYWAKRVGTWHEGCDRPRSLEMYAREAEQKRKMGFGR